MNCKSCSEVVSPKLKFALQNNSCPFCGGEIVAPELKEIFAELTLIMKDAEPFMQQVEDWLGSNYGLYKHSPINQSAILNYVETKTPTPPAGLLTDDNFDQSFLDQQVAMAKAKTATFQQKAQVKVPDTKTLIAKIQNGGAADPSEFVGVDEVYGAFDLSQDQDQPLAPNEALQLTAAFDASYSNNSLEQAIELEKVRKLHSAQRTTETSKVKRRD